MHGKYCDSREVLLYHALAQARDKGIPKVKMPFGDLPQLCADLLVSGLPLLSGSSCLGFAALPRRSVNGDFRFGTGVVVFDRVDVIGAIYLFVTAPAAVVAIIFHRNLLAIDLSVGLNLHGKLGDFLFPGIQALQAFLIINGALQLVSEVRCTNGVENSVFPFRVFNLIQLHVLTKGGTPGHRLSELFLIQFQQLHAPPDGRGGEAAPLSDAVHSLPHVEHKLNALGLLIDGQVAALHILHQHGPELLLGRHFHDGAWQFLNASLLRRSKAAMANDYGILSALLGNDRQVLEYSVGFDAVRKFRQISKDLARIVLVGVQVIDPDHCDFRHVLLLSRFTVK